MIIGRKDKFVPIDFLRKFLRIAPNVGRVVVNHDGNPSFGTGFMIDDKTLVTCDYILPSDEVCRSSVFQTN